MRSRESVGLAAREARTFLALADPTRRRILQLLGDGELRASAIAAKFPVTRPAISRHLRVLREADLLTMRAAGRERLYAIAPGPLREAAAYVQSLDTLWHGGLARLGDHLAQNREKERHPTGARSAGERSLLR